MSNLVGTRSTSKAARTHWASICPRHLQVSGYFYRKVFQSQVLPCDTLVGSLTECVPGRSLASFPIDDCPGRQSSVVYPYIFRMSPRVNWMRRKSEIFQWSCCLWISTQQNSRYACWPTGITGFSGIYNISIEYIIEYQLITAKSRWQSADWSRYAKVPPIPRIVRLRAPHWAPTATKTTKDD